MPLTLLFFFIFLILTIIICYQDFKSRLVSLWVLLLYFFTCLAYTYLLKGAYTLLANALSTLVYFGLIFGVLILYYFVKEKKLSNPVNSKIGLADVILFVAIGLTLDIVQLVLFFSAAFLISAVLGLLWFNKKSQTVPLAALLGALYLISYLVEW